MSASRTDLLHLSPEALTQAANAGIVKRALRELEGGYRPQWTETEGTVDASFSDGVRTVWPPATPIQQVRCSCNATSVCRHRIILALAYREAAQQVAAPVEAGSPGAASDEAVARVIPAALLARAQALRDAGIAIDVHRAGGGEPCATARLPAATVRFWAGASIEAARCDCVAATACEHVALGVWAFRAADAEDAAAASVRVRLGRAGRSLGVDRAPWLALADALLRHGVAAGPAPLTQALSHARQAGRELGATWLLHCLDDVEQWSAAYAARSALYEAESGFALLAELSLRLAAGALPGNAQSVLGVGEGEDTELDRLRLQCLGARTTRDGEARRTRLLLADADTGTALLLAHEWKVEGSDPGREASTRAGQKLAPGVRMEALAQGQLLARQAHRRANGTVALARSRSAQNSVLPQLPDWGSLGAPLRFDSVAALRAHQRSHPTAQVLPRHAARRFVVFTPAEVDEPAYDATAQAVAAVLTDAQGESLVVRRHHESHVAPALDAVAAALRGAHGPLRHVAGLLRWSGEWPVLEPWAFACDRLVVPDFEAADGALAQVALGHLPGEADHPLARVLSGVRSIVAELLHHGLPQLPPGWLDRCATLAKELGAQSLPRLARGLEDLRTGVAAARANPRETALAGPLLELAALVQLHEDAMVLAGLPAEA